MDIKKEQFSAQLQNFNRFIDSLYADLDFGVLSTTSPGNSEYQEILHLNEIPLIKSDARVLDVGSGKSTASSDALGITGEFVRTDINPQENSGISYANILNLPFENNSFDEVWALFVIKYIDRIISLPDKVDEKLNLLADKYESDIPNRINFINQMAGILGLKAIIELLRVASIEGRVRIASYEYDFNEGVGFYLFNLWRLSKGSTSELTGLDISEEFSTTNISVDKEKVLVITKNSNFKIESLIEFLFKAFDKLIPEPVRNEILGTV